MHKLCSVLFAMVAGMVSAQTSQPAQSFLDKPFVIETIFVSLIVFLCYCFLQGRRRNKDLLSEFVRSCSKVFQKNFFYGGLNLAPLEETSEEVSGEAGLEKLVEEDTANFFRIYLTGRQNIKYCIASLSLKRRQDVVVNFLYSLFSPERDRIHIEVLFEDQPAPKGLCYIVRQRNVKKSLADFEDMKALCKRFKVDHLEVPGLVVFGENEEVVDLVCSKEFADAVRRNGEMLESLELSDCITSELHKGLGLKMCLNLGKCSSEEFARAAAFLTAFFGLVDRIAAYGAPRRLADEMTESREKFFARKEKERARESGEADSKSIEAKVAKMTPAERRKWEEKEEKRQKAKQSKMFKVVKK